MSIPITKDFHHGLLGAYAVTAKIGEGGMGEVYQARDTTLDRDVALKVLPEAFTSDPGRLARLTGVDPFLELGGVLPRTKVLRQRQKRLILSGSCCSNAASTDCRRVPDPRYAMVECHQNTVLRLSTSLSGGRHEGSSPARHRCCRRSCRHQCALSRHKSSRADVWRGTCAGVTCAG